ncbi:MAG TPA: ornithine cyclodeaminase family protein [Chloroflexota bacterium]|nr:ornithine cyclodeaminase family protein [Chloroflexota bacterium]
MALLLGKRDVAGLLQMDELVPALEAAQIEYSAGKCVQPMRYGVKIPGHPGSLDMMSGYLPDSDALAVKVLSLRTENPNRGLPIIHATALLLDSATGRLLALMDGGAITAARTAAVSGVATRYLARPDATSLGIIGTGRQARTHLWAMTVVRDIRLVRVYNPHQDSALAFKMEMEARFGIPIEVMQTPESVVRGADILVLSTTATEPVVRSEWVSPGMHINSIASATPQVREMESAVVARAKVVVDSREAALHEAGDLLIPISEGLISADHIYGEVGEIAGGIKAGRTSAEEITVYKSLGLAIQDTAVAKVLYEKAVSTGVGLQVDLGD